MPNLLSEFSTAALIEEVEKRKDIKGRLDLVSRALSEAEKCLALLTDGSLDAADLAGVGLSIDALQELAKHCAGFREKLTTTERQSAITD